MNQPQSDIETKGELNFKPLTAGLGFTKIEEKKEEFIARKALQRQQKAKEQKPLDSESRPIKRGELAPFYNDRVEAPVPKMTEIPLPPPSTRSKDERSGNLSCQEKTGLKPAKPITRIFSYFVDLIVITSAIAITLTAIMYILGAPLESGLSIFFEGIPFYIPLLCVLYYLFYFTLMESGHSSSFGKQLMGIRIRTLHGTGTSMVQALLRSALSLFDIAFFGLPSLIQFKENFSETQVVKCSHEKQ